MPREEAQLAHLVEALAGAKIAVLGDVMLDRYVDGAVDRISPEAPIPILAIAGESAVPGGAGNVARNLAALGASCHLIGLVGRDAEAGLLSGLLAQEANVTCALVETLDRPTAVKTRFMAGGHQLLRTDRERIAAPDDAAGQALLTALDRAFAAGARVLVLSDYGKGVLSDAIIRAAIAKAKAAGAQIVVDPKGRDYARYAGADFVTPNRKELREATDLPTDSDGAVEAACRSLIASAGIKAVLATRSEQGMTLVAGGAGTLCHLPAKAREVFDVAGAGDTVVAALAAGLAVGVEPELAARLANVAAGIVVGKRGTAVALPGEILAALETPGPAREAGKVLDRPAAMAQAERWRAQGLTIGFTNGCFDILHPGHVSLLRQARAACDRLVVAINTDASVSRLKGPTRPIQQEANRAAVLAALESVDCVTLFGEDTPLELIRAIRPDVLVKGADYTVDTVVGASDVQSWGGKVVLAQLVEGQSTTAIASRMAKPA